MSFAAPVSIPRSESSCKPEFIEIEQSWWPSIDVERARDVMRLNGTVTDTRLVEALQVAAYSINRELAVWQIERQSEGVVGLDDERLQHLYLRAVSFHAKAELIERYRDFDTTLAGDRRAEAMDDSAADARRTVRWAISELLGKPRLTVELM